MIETPHVTQLDAERVAVIPVVVPRSRIQEVMGAGIGELMAAVTAQGVGPTGPWFSHHLRMDPEVFDFEIGVPVSGAVTPVGRVVPGLLPAARVARCTYVGPYEGLGAAWGEFRAWVASHGLRAADDLWERYLVGPESGPAGSAYHTELVQPLVG